MNVLPEPIIIYDYMHKPIGQLTPWDIQMYHGCINQVMYIFEYKKDNIFCMSIEDPADAHKYYFGVTKNIEQQFPDNIIPPGLLKPVSLFGMENESIENAKDFVKSNLKYKITLSTEEMIRGFLNLPMQTHLIIWVRTFEFEKTR